MKKCISFLIFWCLMIVMLPLQAAPAHYAIIYELNTQDCFLKIVKDQSQEKFVIKQIKNPDPDEQFLLVMDALGCSIAESINLPINRVTLLKPYSYLLDNSVQYVPATLHTFASGVALSEKCRYQDLDIHQQWRSTQITEKHGSLEIECVGLTRAIIKNMSLHKDLPKIVALDTFVGKVDRSSPNIFYDEIADRFFGIDMAASYSINLSKYAYNQLKVLLCKNSTDFTTQEIEALIIYRETLKKLTKIHHADSIKKQLTDLTLQASFVLECNVLPSTLNERIFFHNRVIDESCEYASLIINLLENI